MEHASNKTNGAKAYRRGSVEDSKVSTANANAFTFPDIVDSNSSKIFQQTNKLNQATSSTHSNKKKSSQKDPNYQSISHFTNGNGAPIGQHNLAFNYAKDKNNLSMLSSSTVDSKDMEIVIDSSSTSQRNLIPTTNPRNLIKANALQNAGIMPPGQVVSSHGFKVE